jgi:hypothetical protein
MGMPENVVVEVLAAHADRLVSEKAKNEDYLDLFPDDRDELAPLLRIAELVRELLMPVTPAPAFEAGLKHDLLAAAIRRTQEQQSNKQALLLQRRGILIGVAGSGLSVVGIVVVLLWRRSIARAYDTTTCTR